METLAPVADYSTKVRRLARAVCHALEHSGAPPRRCSIALFDIRSPVAAHAIRRRCSCFSPGALFIRRPRRRAALESCTRRRIRRVRVSCAYRRRPTRLRCVNSPPLRITLCSLTSVRRTHLLCFVVAFVFVARRPSLYIALVASCTR